MYFDSLELSNFGPFADLKVQFDEMGTNLVIGMNGSGKTQFIGAIVSSLLGRNALDIRADTGSSSRVVLTIVEGNVIERVVTTLAVASNDTGESEQALVRQVHTESHTSHVGVLADHLKTHLTSTSPPSLLLSLQPKMQGRMHSSFNALESEVRTDSSVEARFSSALRDLPGALSKIEALSSGQIAFLTLANEWAARRQSSRRIPLLIDEPFHLLDYETSRLSWELLEEIGRSHQIILASSPGHIPEYINSDIEVSIDLPTATPSKLAPLSYNYSPRGFGRINAVDQATFMLGQPMSVEENRYFEFKEVRGSNPVQSLANVIDEYVVAYLNMDVYGVGHIYWGVRDSDRTVVGVNLSAQQRDRIRRLVVDKLSQIRPDIAPSSFSVEFHPVSESGILVDDLFVIEVQVDSAPSPRLFSTGSGKVFIKTDTGKKKLSPIEIQEEVLRRNKPS